MTLEELRKHYGSIPKAAVALGVVRQAVYQWKNGIPASRQYQIQVLTKGRLRADRQAETEAEARV